MNLQKDSLADKLQFTVVVLTCVDVEKSLHINLSGSDNVELHIYINIAVVVGVILSGLSFSAFIE